jgi:hypothetical protein
MTRLIWSKYKIGCTFSIRKLATTIINNIERNCDDVIKDQNLYEEIFHNININIA